MIRCLPLMLPLCALISGCHDADAAECVRRMAETNAKPDNVANDPSNGSAVCESGRGPRSLLQSVSAPLSVACWPIRS